MGKYLDGFYDVTQKFADINWIKISRYSDAKNFASKDLDLDDIENLFTHTWYPFCDECAQTGDSNALTAILESYASLDFFSNLVQERASEKAEVMDYVHDYPNVGFMTFHKLFYFMPHDDLKPIDYLNYKNAEEYEASVRDFADAFSVRCKEVVDSLSEGAVDKFVQHAKFYIDYAKLQGHDIEIPEYTLINDKGEIVSREDDAALREMANSYLLKIKEFCDADYVYKALSSVDSIAVRASIDLHDAVQNFVDEKVSADKLDLSEYGMNDSNSIDALSNDNLSSLIQNVCGHNQYSNLIINKIVENKIIESSYTKQNNSSVNMNDDDLYEEHYSEIDSFVVSCPDLI